MCNLLMNVVIWYRCGDRERERERDAAPEKRTTMFLNVSFNNEGVCGAFAGGVGGG